MSRYNELFSDYIDELNEAHAAVMAWWRDLLERELEIAGDVVAAERSVLARWPMGPVSHPRIIAVYRKYYLLCDKINMEVRKRWEHQRHNKHTSTEADEEKAWGVEKREEEEGICPPQIVLFDWLGIKHDELATFMSGLVFASIGTNPDGDSC